MIVRFYVQLVPEYGYYDQLKSIKAARVTQLKPIKTVPNAAVIKFEVDVPEVIFEPMLITAVVNPKIPDEIVATADLEESDYALVHTD